MCNLDKEDISDLMDIAELQVENNRLHSIIKEVREYIESYNLPKDLGFMGEAPITISELKHILEILDKEKENE